MDYQQEFVVDFVRRTRRNLDFIERSVAGPEREELYEVTQLVNSLLGIVVLPRENFIRHIPETPLDDLTEAGWPVVDKLIGDYPENCTTLRELVTNLRHSIAHFNIEFIADPQTHELTGLTLWNRYRGQERWRTTVTLEELRQLTLLLFEVIEHDASRSQAFWKSLTSETE